MLKNLAKETTKPATQQEVEQAVENRSQIINRGEKIMESTSSVIMGKERKWRDRYRALMDDLDSANESKKRIAAQTALVMNNQYEHLEQCKQMPYGESTIINNLGPMAGRVIDIVRIFYPTMIANLIAEIHPLDKMNGEILTVKPIYSNTGGGVNAKDEVFRTPTDGTYASDNVNNFAVGTGDGATANFTATITPGPIRPGTVKVFVNGVLVATDDGAGGLVGATLHATTASTVSYASSTFDGAIDITFAANVTNGHAITLNYRYDYETNPANIRELEIGLNLQAVKAKGHPLAISYSVAAELAAQSQYNFDVQDTVSNLAAQFIKKERDYQLTSLILQAATAESTLDFDAAVPAGGGLTRKQHFQDFMIKITEGDSIIYRDNNLGHVSYIIAGNNPCNLIMQMTNFVPEPRTAPIGAHKIGTLDNSVDIIRDRSLPPNKYVMAFRGMQLGDAAIVLADFVPIYMTPLFQNPNLTNKQGMDSYYDILLNNEKYFISGDLSNYTA